LKIDREIQSYLEEYTDAKGVAESLEVKLQAMPEDCEVNTSDILQEIDTVRQMAKMTVGRQGNHFPLLTREFFHCMPRQTGYRENVIDLMAKIESIDPGAFCRVHKNNQNRIVPYVLLVPTYGDSGMCWEPFDRYNRVTSRGRIVVPMYPRNLEIALLTAVADLRWQVAKEKASYYWMEEGLTGQYYQWFYTQKLKGDVKEYFINDYILWMTKESEGVQRLEKDVRGVFWRHMPFSQEIKENLRTRSLVYQELYQRDLNRAMSDGY
jgi:translation elongation factor EF-1beta